MLTVDLVEQEPLGDFSVDELTTALAAAYDQHGPTGIPDAAVELITTDDASIRALNKTHRNLDEVTDVLSFPISFDSERGAVAPDVARPLHLGTIVISLPQAKRQIGRFGTTYAEEVIGLAIHGLRHLLGEDHDSEGSWNTEA